MRRNNLTVNRKAKWTRGDIPRPKYSKRHFSSSPVGVIHKYSQPSQQLSFEESLNYFQNEKRVSIKFYDALQHHRHNSLGDDIEKSVRCLHRGLIIFQFMRSRNCTSDQLELVKFSHSPTLVSTMMLLLNRHLTHYKWYFVSFTTHAGAWFVCDKCNWLRGCLLRYWESDFFCVLILSPCRDV